MHPRFLTGLILIALFFAGCATRTEEIEQPPPSTPGFFGRTAGFILSPFKKRDRTAVMMKQLALTLELTPMPLRLSDTRQLSVALKLANRSRRFVHLQFPTTQRIEILVYDKQRKIVTQWSEDRSFENVASYAAINPGERIEYNTFIPTRDMIAGEPYTVEAFFPNYEKLKAQQTFVPLP